MKKRNPALVIIFSIITCGIYELYWFVVTTNDIQRALKQPDGKVSSGGFTILFSIITCGIYMLYWWYQQGKRIATLMEEKGLRPNDNSIMYLVLNFVAIGAILNPVFLQSDLNKIIDTPPTPASTDVPQA